MGKEEEFAQIVRDNEGVIFKITTIYTTNGQDQKDLYQDIVCQLWKSYDSFRNEAKISTWMYRVALNTAIRQLQKRKRKPHEVSIDQVVLRQTENSDL
jgi:RNA polymerase sigma-70 factor (ECF subfamily)